MIVTQTIHCNGVKLVGKCDGRSTLFNAACRQFPPISLSEKTCLWVKYVFRRCSTTRCEIECSFEQRYAIKFCVRLGKNATRTFRMLQKVFKDDWISSTQSKRWHKAVKEDREEIADEPLSDPTTDRTDENVNSVSKVLRSDRRLSI